jgi:glutamate-1-semialdehyde 2,1-aminomutase
LNVEKAYQLFLEQHLARTPESARLYETAREHLAGGVCGKGGARLPYPLYVAEARGAKLIDVDGNVYIDTLIGGGPSILGHSAPAIMDVVRDHLDAGTCTIAPPSTAIELAARIKGHMPHLELLRFTHTGSEAVQMCLRAARAFTGRRVIGKFEGNYHGGMEGPPLVSGTSFEGPEDEPVGVPEGSGQPAGVRDDTLVLPYNNVEATVALIERHASELAAVLLEPVCGHWLAGVAAEQPFLEALRDVTARHGVLLVYDEVLTGFRIALGGAVELTGVVPDLTALAKTIGGGFPLGAYGGRREIMEQVVAPPRDAPRHQAIYQSGTFQSNLVSLRAGLTMLGELAKPGVYERLHAAGDTIRNGIADIAGQVGIPVRTIGVGPIFGVYFTDRPVRSLRDALGTDLAASRAFDMGLLASGVFTSGGHTGLTNLAQTDDDLEQILDAARYVLKIMKDES